jgi:2-oxo-4-hydroxy-4-carboxy-5-ureidoimidazoline decarboxylase
MSEVLERWNGVEAGEAAALVLACNGSRAWARGVAARRPYGSEEALLEASDGVWLGLKEADWCEAFATHPRIGERHAAAASGASLAWSGKEQAAAELGSEDDAALLAALNLEYERRFGTVFLICASGLSKGEILAALQDRMGRSTEEELNEAVEQQRKMTRLRLARWMRGE